MPDIDGFGRGLVKGARAATEKVTVTGVTVDDPDATQEIADPDATQVITVDLGATPRTSVTDFPPASGQLVLEGPADLRTGEPALSDEPDEHADAADVHELVELFQRVLADRRPPAGPVEQEWSLGVGDLLAAHPRVPERVRGRVLRLNRVAGLSLTPTAVTVDGADVAWEKITEVRTRHVVDHLLGDAVRQQVENLPVPWFPGRRRVLDALGQAVLTITITAATERLDRADLDHRVPAELAHTTSAGAAAETSAGVLSAILLTEPAISRAFLATAAANGVPVTAGDEPPADRVREKVAALAEELARFTNRFGRDRERG